MLLCDPILPGSPVPMDRTSGTVLRVDPVTNICLDTAPKLVNAHTATFSAFTDLVPNDYAPEIFLAHTPRVDVPLMLKQSPHLISGVVTISGATFTTSLLFVVASKCRQITGIF